VKLLLDSPVGMVAGEGFSASGSIDPCRGDRQQPSEHLDRR
jgi:hypothetical protein